MNDDALDLSELDGTGIRLCYGLTASLAKDGAKLMLPVPSSSPTPCTKPTNQPWFAPFGDEVLL